MNKLYWNTVTDDLKEVLYLLMQEPLFDKFRLVGGTSLSLQIGHRLSIDIDMFTDATYGSIDFDIIIAFLENNFKYVDYISQVPISFGKSFFIGNNKSNAVKLDLYYTDTYFQKPMIHQGIRMATIEEIIAMKLEVIQNNGRKKDFWDLHELLNNYTLTDLLNLHKTRYPYTHDKVMIIENLKNCNTADDDFDPICLKNKHWSSIKLDIIEFISKNELHD